MQGVHTFASRLQLPFKDKITRVVVGGINFLFLGITVRLLSIDGALRASCFHVVVLSKSVVSKVLPLPGGAAERKLQTISWRII